MVLLQAAAAVYPPPGAALSQDEIFSCMNAKEDCSRILKTLGAFRQAHSNAEGHPQPSLAMAEKYRRTLEHLDAACDGLFEIINS